VSLRLVAPPGVAPGTSAVSVCAHKEDKDARKLLRAGRMSGATRQPCPLHWGHGPTPTKPKRHERIRLVLSPSVLSVHSSDAKATKASAKHVKIGPKERGA